MAAVPRDLEGEYRSCTACGNCMLILALTEAQCRFLAGESYAGRGRLEITRVAWHQCCAGPCGFEHQYSGMDACLASCGTR